MNWWDSNQYTSYTPLTIWIIFIYTFSKFLHILLYFYKLCFFYRKYLHIRGPSSCPSLDKGRSIKELVFRWVLLNLIPRLFEQKGEIYF